MWVVIISVVYFLFGVNAPTPFILNIIFQILTIVIAYFIFKKYEVSKFLFLALLAVILITPMPTNLFAGMEHPAHTAFSLLFVYFAVKLIINENNRSLKYLLLITPILTGFRYESMFLILVVALLLLFRRKFFYAALLVVVGLMPIVIYGIFSSSHGWLFLPNTILLKSSPPDYTLFGILKFIIKAFKNITQPHIFSLLIISSFLYIFSLKKKKEFWCEKKVFLLVVIFTTIINMSLIEYHINGAFYRYDAYLIALNTVAIIINIYDLLPGMLSLLKERNYALSKCVIIILNLVVISPLMMRAFTAFEVPIAVKEYHNQQYQMAHFIKDNAPGINIAANDIGMISYFSENKVVDLWGVANIEVAKAMLDKSYSTNTISEVSKKENVRMAILYEHWFDEFGGLPSYWIKIGEWSMTNVPLFLGSGTVSFYCMNSEDADNYRTKLKDFSIILPKSVVFKIFK